MPASSIISMGLGTWGSPSVIITLGFESGAASVASGSRGGGGSGMTEWDGEKYYSPEALEKISQKRVYFDESHARPIREAQEVIEKAQTQEFTPVIYEEAVDVVVQLRTEIFKLQGLEGELKAVGKEVEAIRAGMAIAQMEAQIEEIDTVFMIMMISAQLH